VTKQDESFCRHRPVKPPGDDETVLNWITRSSRVMTMSFGLGSSGQAAYEKVKPDDDKKSSRR
jgi:hypothetical protein